MHREGRSVSVKIHVLYDQVCESSLLCSLFNLLEVSFLHFLLLSLLRLFSLELHVLGDQTRSHGFPDQNWVISIA